MPKTYYTFAGVRHTTNGVPIGLEFPVDVRYKTICGPAGWQQFLKDQDTLFAEWTTFRAERDLLAAHIRGEITYEKIHHLVEAEPLPEPECNCFMPEQTCSVCDREGMDALKMTGEELPF